MKLFDENGRHVGDLHDGDSPAGCIGSIIFFVALLPNAFIFKYLGMTVYIVVLCIILLFASYLYFFKFLPRAADDGVGIVILWIFLYPLVMFLLFLFQDVVTSIVAGTSILTM